MFERKGLVALLAGATLALSACDKAPTPGGGDGVNTAQTNSAQTNTAQTDTGTGGGSSGGQTCGGFGNQQCSARTDFCKIPEGQCGTADAQGTCTPRPELCTKEFDPVCGCDGQTYGNACEAAAKGVNVESKGECAKGGG